MNLDDIELNFAQAKVIREYVNNGLLDEENQEYNSNLLEVQDICSQIKDYDNLNNDIETYIDFCKKQNSYIFRNVEFGEELIKILNIYTNKEWQDEPLDSDEVDILVEHLRNQLNLINGNLTNEEYNNLENK